MGFESKYYKNDYIIKKDNTFMENDYDVDYSMIKIRDEMLKHASIAGINQIVESNGDINIIGTWALDTCYGIFFYDRENKWGIVGHALPSSNIKILHRMLDMLGNRGESIIEYGIVPGYRNIERRDYRGFDEMIAYLYSNCPSNIKLKPFKSDLGVSLSSKVLAYEFAFDVNSGLSASKFLFYEGTNLKRDKYRR